MDRVVIDEYLKKQGKAPNGDVLYKLVWSDSQTEFRKHPLAGLTACAKYSYISERWILEKWAGPELVKCGELPETEKGSYEPLWVFESNKGEYLDPNLKVIEFIIQMSNRQTLKTASERLAEFVKREDQEIEYFLDSLDISPIQNALHMKEATGYTKEIKDDK